MEKIYILSEADKKEYYTAMAKRIYKEEIKIVENINEADQIFAIDGAVPEEAYAVPIVQMTAEFIPKKLYEAVLNNTLVL